MSGMSATFGGRCTRRMSPLRWLRTHQMFLACRIEGGVVTLPGADLPGADLPNFDRKRSSAPMWLVISFDCRVAHNFWIGHSGHLGSPGTHTVAPSSIMA